ncbi:hypothetical protein N0B40_09755 [Chryseobacterium oranimense]|uniref:PKD domain-containing protein n=1 Tax=Chryseobacterium oranimense TaxID=421058 RepID=UPI0021AEA90F|nr:hypothetical protein [Chryseobacterium oranimense]UWX62559.1 hypothetical protein N0B40_09755 [Chryseobacterium oranimense]
MKQFISILILIISTQIIKAQVMGDYKSVATGNWTTLSTWNYYNGTAWVAATSYPGQNTSPVASNVTISSGNTVNVPANLTLVNLAKITINGGVLSITNNNVTLALPANTKISIINGGSISVGTPCSSNKVIQIGTVQYASCSGGSGMYASFAELNTGGGSLTSVPTVSPNFILSGQSVVLSGNYSGFSATVPSYSWAGTGPGGYTFNSTTKNPGSITLTTSGLYIYRLTVTSSNNGVTVSDFVDITVFVDLDSDGDLVGNSSDLDDDNDGISDTNEQTCLSPISIGVDPNPVASENYGGTTATYTEVSGSVSMYSYGGYNGFDPSGFPSKLRIDYSKNLINYAFRVSDLDNQEKIRVYVYDKNGSLIPDISSYITYKGSNVKTTTGAGYSLLIEGINGTGGTNNSFDPANYIDFKILPEVSRIDYDFYARSSISSPEYYFLGGCVVKDTDNDGISDYLDLDSDNDGCLDALEGGANLATSNLVTAGGTVTVGTGSTASNQNLGNTVDANGVPTVASGGQSIGTSENPGIKAAVCLYCYKPATTAGSALPTNYGITALGRAGTGNGNWPMVRNGAWTALEAKTKGFVINRISTTAAVNAIPNPVEGMMVYDAEADCLKINTNGTSTGWKCFNTQTCP